MTPQIKRNTIEVDAAGQAVGRVASLVATYLQGKHKPDYIAHIDNGDMVIVLNAGKVKFTGKKLVQKDFKHHSMHPGGLKVRAMKHVFDKNPGDVIRHAVNGMVPKNRRREILMKRLTVKA